MKTLKLFNGVISKESNDSPYINTELGYIIEPNALWLKNEIVEYYKTQQLNGEELNKTFHKSWAKIKNSSRYELLFHQIMHYFSTYGSEFKSEMYVPNEILELPNENIKFKVIKGYTKEEMIEKCLGLLQSGIALKRETIEDVINLLTNDLDYGFNGNENIKNKEAIIYLADKYNILPKDIMEFFRYIIYKTTDETLLIKNDYLINKIKESTYNPQKQFNDFGLIKLAEIFNRFKPLFLAFKNKCPQTINKISKLSKTYHKPLVVNKLNTVTSELLTKKDIHWLDNATPFAIFKALQACYSRMNGQNTFIYRIRNGKSWVKTKGINSVNQKNYNFILDYLKNKIDFTDKKFYLPKDIEYTLPTSEKMFVGNIPTGTKFHGEKLAVGIYWENQWGANDFDLSTIDRIGNKIGWNSEYKNNNNSLLYSGDLTNAINGAAEYMYATNGLSEPNLIYNNVYDGDSNSVFNFIIGKGDNIDYNYMINPNKVIANVKTISPQKESVLGFMLPNDKNNQTFILLNFGTGNMSVSSYNEQSDLMIKGLYEQWSNQYMFHNLINDLNGEIVNDPKTADYNYSIDSLEKDSFTKIFH